MGRKLLLKKMRAKGVILMVLGVILTLTMIFALKMYSMEGGRIFTMIALALLAGGGIAMVCVGVDYLRGEKSRYMKARPNALELADDLYAHTIYEDKFVMISEKAIASKKDITGISDVKDVLAVYEEILRSNGLQTGRSVKMDLRNGKTIEINIYGRKKETKDNLILTISHYCPNAAVGYSDQNMAYVKAQQKAYKETMN